MTAWITSGLVVVGAAFMLLAAVGVLRMPDLYTRLHATTKAATLGTGCLLVAFALRFAHVDTAVGALLLAVFLFLTGPVAAHLLGRVAYMIDVPRSAHTERDELADGYDVRTHSLYSGRRPRGDGAGDPASRAGGSEHGRRRRDAPDEPDDRPDRSS